jgi:hypothetical protein
MIRNLEEVVLSEQFCMLQLVISHIYGLQLVNVSWYSLTIYLQVFRQFPVASLWISKSNCSYCSFVCVC